VKLNYATSKGRMVLIRATTQEGDALPFGASVKDSQGEHIGVVAQGGQIYARLNVGKERLNINWGNRQQYTCTFDIDLKESAPEKNIERLNTVCDGDDPGIQQSLAFTQSDSSKNDQGQIR
jgi:outer membrane usher protein